jgi:hypothetical protein
MTASVPQPINHRPPSSWREIDRKPCKYCGQKFRTRGLPVHERKCFGPETAPANHCQECGVHVTPGSRACFKCEIKDADFRFVEWVIRAGFGDRKWKRVPAAVIAEARRAVANV